MNRRQPRRWVLHPGDPDAEQALRAAQRISPIFARLLVNRSITSPEAAEAFLHPSYAHLADPFLLPDAEPVVERLKQAIQKKESIFIHGDYDSDGVTSAALWMRLLEKLGANVRVHVPHRKRDGYDMRDKFIEQARKEGTQLILTTDCGIKRREEVEQAREAGMDVIITDHHLPEGELPRAVGVVNPHRPDSRYPFKDIAGVGVAFRLGEALVRHLGLSVDSYRRAYSDLAAIGTITDIMPITGENRVFVKYGLETLRHTQKPGLQALIEATGLNNRPLNVDSIGYVIGPRLNAIGRVDDSRIALDLLLTRDPREAVQLAEQLEAANQKRQEEQRRIFEEAKEKASRLDIHETACLVLWGKNWHAGVIGIVAAKIKETYHRPTVLIALDDAEQFGRGSARSIHGYNIERAIAACEMHLEEFGGHEQAAGFSIQAQEVAAFAQAMNRVAASQLTEEDFMPTIEADAEVDPAEVTLGLLEELAPFEPWGRSNPEPIFISRGVEIVEARRIGKDQSHLKLRVRAPGMPPTDAVMWGHGDFAEFINIGSRFDLCYQAQANHYNGTVRVQFMLKDLKPSEDFS